MTLDLDAPAPLYEHVPLKPDTPHGLVGICCGLTWSLSHVQVHCPPYVFTALTDDDRFKKALTIFKSGTVYFTDFVRQFQGHSICHEGNGNSQYHHTARDSQSRTLRRLFESMVPYAPQIQQVNRLLGEIPKEQIRDEVERYIRLSPTRRESAFAKGKGRLKMFPSIAEAVLNYQEILVIPERIRCP